MLRSRIIPTLLVRDKGLVKTFQFKNSKYVGDPINAVKIFNEKEVDELIVLDIDATKKGESPNFEMIKNIAVECRMPLCYGGGIKTVDQAKKIVKLGSEKIALSSSAIENTKILSDIGNVIGFQSVVVVLDYKVQKSIFGNQHNLFTVNGTKKINENIFDFINKISDIGVGEIVINSIDRDGLMQGYDFDFIDKVRKYCDIPLTVLGGAGSYDDIKKAIDRYGIIGAAAGSVFVFKGKYKAVLINYPTYKEKFELNKKNIVSQ